MSKAAQFRSLLERGSMIIAPGAIECITARAIAHAGFPAAYMTGGGTSMSMGYPDYGLITMTEMVANASRIANSIDIPLISDGDTGYGNELNVYRTVQEFERIGVAAIHLEDQAFPKTCSVVEGAKVELASREDYIAKIRAAAAARKSKDFCIIGRTDACAVAGLDEAVERANLALSNGADVAYVESLQTMADVEAVPKRVRGPCLTDMSLSNKEPALTLAVAERFGYAIAILPGAVLSGIFEICDQRLADLKQGKLPPAVPGGPAPLFARFGAADWDARRTAFRDPIATAAE
ncbi:MAG TPA: isocitrate lyase/PEP mutase family protein [Allosphingosinicella sp.]|nr:isocitrate lyase/PEP mutase family protein [Allosphingosinicella sp.]